MITRLAACGKEKQAVGKRQARDSTRALLNVISSDAKLTSITIRAPRIIRASLLRFPLTRVTRSLS